MSWNIQSLQDSLLIGSTLVEGSTLTESEAKSILTGKTVLGHPISEARELLNYRAAIEWLMLELKKSPYVSLDLILHFHAKLFQGFPGEHGRWKNSQNFTYLSDGNRFDYLSASLIDAAMMKWVADFNSSTHELVTEKAAQLYYEFQRIHPFEDGNGRIGRILIAYWLHWQAKQSFHFRLKDKIEHLKALESANRGDLKLLNHFFKTRTKSETKR